MSFTTLDPTDFVVSTDAVTAPAWSSNLPVLSTFFTGSQPNPLIITQNSYYLDVYQTASTAQGAAVQFSIAYGSANGGGSKWYNNLVPGVSPSLTTYKQYRTLVYGTALTSSAQGFNFGGASQATNIFAINVDRSRYKESLFPGTFNLTLSYDGEIINLTDNSVDLATNNQVVPYLDCGRAYDIVLGANGRATTAPPPPGASRSGYTLAGSYGLFLPDIGTIILNGDALMLSVANGGLDFGTNMITTQNYTNAEYPSYNNIAMFFAIRDGAYFQLNSYEATSANYVFVRVRNSDYNYSSNPTYISSSGDLAYPTLINSPQTYITTVGMYNTSNELLAVAKLSRPLLKDFTKEALLRVKLDW